MKKILGGTTRLRLIAVITAAAMLGMAWIISITPAFSRPAEPTSDAALLDGYRHVEVASVSDAMEKVIGQRMYLSHRMNPEELDASRELFLQVGSIAKDQN